jgi:hypothetical protein
MSGMPSAATDLVAPRAVSGSVSEDTLTVDLDDGRTVLGAGLGAGAGPQE